MYLHLVLIAILFLLLLVTIIFALVYFGFFSRVNISTGPSPFHFNNQRIVYKVGEGDYASSSAIFTELVSIIPKRVTLGIYVRVDDELRRRYADDNDDKDVNLLKRPNVSAFASDDLQVTEFDHKRGSFAYTVAAIVTGQNLTRAQKHLLRDKGYGYRELPSEVKHSVYCTFPFKGILSTVAGASKVYPALCEYIQERRLCAYPMVELYDRDEIHFIVPLAEQENFMGLLDAPISLEGYIETDDEEDEGEDEEKSEYESDETRDSKDDTDLDDSDTGLINDDEASNSPFEEL